jgi:flagellar biosynthesis GTPase FlhF
MKKLLIDASNLCFFGFPGSGVASTIARISKNYLELKIKPIMVISDDYHIGKREQLKIIASIMDIETKEVLFKDFEIVNKNNEKHLVYLRGFSSNNEFHEYDTLFSNKELTKIFILDCSRKNEINKAFLEEFYSKIDAVVLTKRDMVKNFSLDKYIEERKIPVLHISKNEALYHIWIK